MMKQLLMLSVIVFSACAVTAADDPAGPENHLSASSVEQSERASAVGSEGSAIAQGASCQIVLLCRSCGIPSRHQIQNIEVQQCSDGTSTVLFAWPCGQDCF